MTTPPEPPKLKPVFLHLGTLAVGASEDIQLRAPIPAGLAPLAVNVRLGDGGKVRVVHWTVNSVTITNEGTGPASYMIFGGTPAMHRAIEVAAKVLAAAAQLRGDFARKDPTP
jgi:hypothetical protein